MRRNYPEEAVIFIASLFSSQEVFNKAIPRLNELFGHVYYESPHLPWNFSTYYNGELGAPLYRQFMFFENIVDPVSLVDAKLALCEIEKEFSTGGNRRINLDPGYMSLAKVVLASRKNYSHRIYLGKGVFCELELFFQEGRFNPLPYTYFDYRDDYFLKFFTKARLLLKKELDGKKKLMQNDTVFAAKGAGQKINKEVIRGPHIIPKSRDL
jgi:hypothetical protein